MMFSSPLKGERQSDAITEHYASEESNFEDHHLSSMLLMTRMALWHFGLTRGSTS